MRLGFSVLTALFLFSRTAAQSTKLIVPRYRQGKALFKSKLTANKKLLRRSDRTKYSTIGTDLVRT